MRGPLRAGGGLLAPRLDDPRAGGVSGRLRPRKILPEKRDRDFGWEGSPSKID